MSTWAYVSQWAPTESADGTPHLAYFADGVSFVWSGDPERPIQACSGGYGERVVAVMWPVDVPALDTAERIPASALLRVFRQVCDQWLQEANG